ncbi:hypothetical protein EHQ46_16300 [Leptospira yanagawae]|uniref:DUF2946 domain-containing protein n=1 Tax=Leptospira yanagawae TaxID=293069 RepID=A0ABY2M1F4_9LEPT|nr:hypothetical protein [Leptospira yanagawae]TGL17432.1 hypothetical protein EHQ46_16300 [Leptospira yanagawae]
MKTKGKQSKFAKQMLLYSFVLVFASHFIYQRLVDNEINCGAIGAPESGCPYSFLDHTFGLETNHDLGEEGEHSEHVCISCPCNLIVSITWDLYLTHVLIQLHKFYYVANEIQIPIHLGIKFHFRPPKTILS